MKKQNSNLLKVGLFAISLFVTTIAVYVYSPVIGSNAINGIGSKLDVSIATVISLGLNTNNLDYVIKPSILGEFASRSVRVTVDTNSDGGYSLFLSSSDESSDITNQAGTASFSSDFEGLVSFQEMAANKWGYSLDNVNFSKVPTITEPVAIKEVDNYPREEYETSAIVSIGIKADTSMPSGIYTKDIVFSAVAHNPIVYHTSFTATTFAEMTQEMCANAYLYETTVLTDTRDGNNYTVTKLAGNCWMTQNLRISNMTITPEDSDVTENYTIPASSLGDFANTGVYVDQEHGGYYRYPVATAGTGSKDMETTDAPSSICPKGWRLPKAGAGSESEEFIRSVTLGYNQAHLLRYAANMQYDGEVWPVDGLKYVGSYGYYVSSTLYKYDNPDTSYNYPLGIVLNTTVSGYAGARGQLYYNAGHPIRCIFNLE